MIRLATAHAKARLSAQVTESDAMEAEAILRFALYKEVLKRQRRKKRKLNAGGTSGARAGEESDEESEDEDEEEEQPPARMQTPQEQAQAQAQAKVIDQESQADGGWGDIEMDNVQAAPAGPTADGGIRPER